MVGGESQIYMCRSLEQKLRNNSSPPPLSRNGCLPKFLYRYRRRFVGGYHHDDDREQNECQRRRSALLLTGVAKVYYLGFT